MPQAMGGLTGSDLGGTGGWLLFAAAACRQLRFSAAGQPPWWQLCTDTVAQATCRAVPCWSMCASWSEEELALLWALQGWRAWAERRVAALPWETQVMLGLMPCHAEAHAVSC